LKQDGDTATALSIVTELSAFQIPETWAWPIQSCRGIEICATTGGEVKLAMALTVPVAAMNSCANCTGNHSAVPSELPQMDI